MLLLQSAAVVMIALLGCLQRSLFKQVVDGILDLYKAAAYHKGVQEGAFGLLLNSILCLESALFSLNPCVVGWDQKIYGLQAISLCLSAWQVQQS